jgi:Secretion system C-terminal sorting domain/Ig-like domain CHU_C associated
MIKLLRQKMSFVLAALALMACAVSWGQAYTLNHGFGGPTGVPTGIQVMSYDGSLVCVTTPSNGPNAVTTMVLKAAPGYNFTITSINGVGVRSNAGSTQFNFQLINNGTVNGAVTTVGASSSCNGGTAISTLNVPTANQTVTENNTVTIRVPRSPGSTSGNGYSHVKSITVQGVVSLAIPPAPVATPATGIASVGFTANWNAVTGATGYRLDVATDMAFTQLLENYDNFAVPGTSQYVFMGVEANTTYYYRVRAEINATTSPNSNLISAITPNPVPATVITTQILPANITASTATSGGNVTNDGQAEVTARGVVWAATAAPTTASSLTSNGTGTGTFTSSLATLLPNAQYYYRAYATNSTGTSYGAEYSFYTHANTPGSPTISNADIFSMDIALDVNGNPAGTLYAIMINGEGIVNQYVGLSGGISDTPIWQTAAQWGAVIGVNVLQPDTAYTFSTAAQNAVGVQTPFSPTAQGSTNPLPGPTTITILTNTVDFEPACLSTDPNGAAGSFSLEATNLSGTGMGLGTVLVSGPDGEPLEGISFSTLPDAGFDEGSYLLEDLEEGEDRTVYVRFDPTAGVSYGTLTIEISLIDEMNDSAEPETIEVVIVDLPEAAAAQTVCDDATVANLLTTSGTGIKWYTAATGGTALATTEVLTAQTYYASQSIGECESGRIPVVVTVNPIPDAPVAAAQLFCGPATVAGLTVTTGTAPKWYIAETGGTALEATEALATGTYYVSQTLIDCESPRTAVAVTVNPIPDAPTAPEQPFCGPSTVAGLMVTTGTAPKWYVAETGGIALEATAAIATGTYYVSQTVGGCESARTAVAVTVNPIPAAPTVDNVQTFCTAATVADLEATGDVHWYTAPTGGTALEDTAVIAEGTSIYYVSQTVSGCESTSRSAVAVQLTITPAPVAAAQSFCGNGTVSQLATAGIAPKWYNAATGGTALEGTAALASGNYYVSQTINGCESARTMVAVTVNEIPAAPTASAQAICGSGIVSELNVTTGANPQWYMAGTGGTVLAGNTALATGSYYVSQTVNGCESERTMVAVTVNAIPATPETTPLTLCNSGTVSDLTTTTGTGLQWYMAATGGTALEGTADVANGIYYVSQTVNGCESVRTAVAVTITGVADPVGDDTQDFEAGETLADLEVDGENIVWYAEETLETVLPSTTVLEDEAIYYAVATATEGDCTSEEALAITVNEVLGTDGFDMSGLNFYPNPVNEMLNLSYGDAITSVVVYNLLGQPVLTKEPNTTAVQLDMTSLAAGTYILKVASGDNAATIKVIKR